MKRLVGGGWQNKRALGHTPKRRGVKTTCKKREERATFFFGRYSREPKGEGKENVNCFSVIIEEKKQKGLEKVVAFLFWSRRKGDFLLVLY